MTRKQGLSLRPGIYKVFWKGRKGHKIQGWTWCAIGEVTYEFVMVNGLWARAVGGDRYIMSMNWSGGSQLGSRMWCKIAKVERAPLGPNEST